MAEARRFRLRATYTKAGRLARMSHLEIARALEYAVRRSGLPFAISEGFSPHMKIAFGSALPVGVGSTCEIFDLQLIQYVPAARALEALQASSVADLMVTDVVYIENGAAAASVAYPRSSYVARFEFEQDDEDDKAAIQDALDRLVVPETIERERKGKVKVLEVDNFLPDMPEVEGDSLYFDLVARKDGSLRPDVFLQGCLDATAAADPTFPKLRIAQVTRVAQS
jgi:radical SAM-linked protein